MSKGKDSLFYNLYEIEIIVFEIKKKLEEKIDELLYNTLTNELHFSKRSQNIVK